MLQSNYISYSYGFVRRGLFGELTKIVAKYEINTFLFIKVFSIIILIFVFIYFFNLFKKNGYSLNFLFLPFTLSYTLLSGLIEFKDYFQILLIIFIVYLLKKESIIKYLWINIIAIIGILIHEIFFFISIPFIFIYLFNENYQPKKFISATFKSFGIVLPSFVALIMTIIYHGTPEIAQNLYQESLSLIPSYATNLHISDGLRALGENTENKVIGMFKGKIWNGFSRGVTYVFFVIALLYITLYFNNLKHKTKTNFTPNLFFIFCFQLLAMLPIFVVAIDWSRFISLCLLSSLVYFMEFKNVRIKPIFSHYINQFATISDRVFSTFIHSNKQMFYVVCYFCIIPHLEFGNRPYAFTNSIIMLMNYITKAISIM
ncbi:hypothetical protein [uncultured Weeksella sp.]|uniref:hypothetical protein n=1 Tax=uncultured Weeksella sp. TaxID=1161389 RepID=UPI00259B99AB|nr:hypothetical protein [uncultured Weeksella sp.]